MAEPRVIKIPNPRAFFGKGGIGRELVQRIAIEFGTFGFSQAIRLGSNLILTRLLFPEAFGLMAMLQVTLYGLNMLSDVGIQQAVIRSSRGDDPVLLNTAWTMQVIRGLVLFSAAVLVAAPSAILFAEPTLLWIVPVGALGPLVFGFASTRQFTARRHLRLGAISALEIGSQMVGAGCMISFAYLEMGVLSLLVGTVLQALAHTAGSFMLPGRHRDKFQLDRSARKEIFEFGRWIFASSALTFFSSRGDQVVLGRMLGASGLGFYNVALGLVDAPNALGQRIISGLCYPFFARIYRDNPAELPRVYYRVRLAFDSVMHTGLGFVYSMAPVIIDLLYDSRYQAAYPMLQILAVGVAFNLIAMPCETCLTAQGLTMYGFRRNVFVTASLFILMPVGYFTAGVLGLLWGAALSRLSGLAAVWPAAKQHGILKLWRELLVFVFLAIGYAVGVRTSWVLGYA